MTPSQTSALTTTPSTTPPASGGNLAAPPTEQAPANQPLTLAFSGGGFRATLFHLGVVKCLCEAGLLDRVKRIVSVSGGSIFAAHLVLNWDRYRDPTTFDKTAARLVEFTQMNVRSRIMQRWFVTTLLLALLVGVTAGCLGLYLPGYGYWAFLGAVLLLGAGWFCLPGRTALLQWEYDRLYDGKQLRELKGGNRPHLEMLATSLTSGRLCSFTPDNFHYAESDEVRRTVPCQSQPIALAVAASSAFPPLFPPVTVSAQSLRCRSELLPHPHALTDGGIFDNLGLEAAGSGTPDHRVLLSDAEGPFDVETISAQEHRMIRSTYILMWRLCDYVKRKHTSRVHCAIDGNDSPAEVSNDLRARVAKIRTDLNHFNDDEVYALTLFGYWAARQALAEQQLVKAGQAESWAFVKDERNRPRLQKQADLNGLDVRSAVLSSESLGTAWGFAVWRSRTFAVNLVLAGLVAVAALLLVRGLVLNAPVFPANLALTALGTEDQMKARTQNRHLVAALNAHFDSARVAGQESSVVLLRVAADPPRAQLLPYQFDLICKPGYYVTGVAFTADAKTLKAQAVVEVAPTGLRPLQVPADDKRFRAPVRVPATVAGECLLLVCRIQADAGKHIPADLDDLAALIALSAPGTPE